MTANVLAPTAPPASRVAQEPAAADMSTRLTGVREATRYVRWFEHITKGDVVPAAELLACADESRADLIAIGSLRHERLEQWILGSVTTEVIREGRCSVLVIPPTHRA